MSKRIIATKKINDVDYSAFVDYDFGDDLKDAIAKHSNEVVFTNYKANGTIGIQGGIRRLLEKGAAAKQTSEQIQANVTQKFAGYKLGVAMDRSIDVEAAYMAKWVSMTPEERKAKLAELRSMV